MKGVGQIMKWGVKGFTIIELIVVVTVIGIISTIVVISYGAVQNNARDSALKADLKKISDAVHLKALDDQAIPAGGASDTLEGDPLEFEGISVNPDASVYDGTVTNLYYCSGSIDGFNEFGLVAQSRSGRVFSYLSNRGVQEQSGLSLPESVDGIEACEAIGFAAPFTWSLGYDTNDESFGWASWATPATESDGDDGEPEEE